MHIERLYGSGVPGESIVQDGAKTRRGGDMMDEVYIRMCREAKEIQEQWNRRFGDKFVLKNDVFNKIKFVMGFDVPTTAVWLPWQEDLQELIIDQTHLIPARILMLIFDEFEFIPAHYPEKSKISMATLQVAMGMYNKRWNGDTWETIK